MNYQEFFDRVLEDLKTAKSGIDFTSANVSKVQGESYTGISVAPIDRSVSGILPVAWFYEQLQNGASYEETFARIMDAVEQIIAEIPDINRDIILDYSQVRHTLVMQMIPTRGNETFLATVPHKIIEDMAVIVRVPVNMGADKKASFVITNSLLNTYQVDRDTVIKDAETFAPINEPLRIHNMFRLLLDHSVIKVPEELKELNVPDDAVMWVATVESQVHGACVLDYPGFMDAAANIFKKDFFVLPSSIHEVILVPDDGKYQAQELCEMVRTVNQTDVQPADRLSDVAYHYDTKARIFETATAFTQRTKTF